MSPFAGFKDFNECKSKMMSDGKSEDSANRICGAIQARVEGHVQDAVVLNEEENECVDEYVKKFQDGRPPKDWWDRCVDAVSDKADDPAALCGWIWFHQKKMESSESVIPMTKDEVNATIEQMNKETRNFKAYETLEDVEIFKTGVWNKDKYSEKDLREMVQNFDILKDSVKPPAKVGHSENQEFLKKEGLPAAGWVSKLRLVGDKVVASFKDVPKVIKDLIQKRAYRRVSAEIYPKYNDPQTGKVFHNVLRAVAFLGGDIPAVDSLADIQALYSKSPDGAKWYSLNIDSFTDKGGVVVGKWFRFSVDGEDSREQLTKKLSDALGVKVNVENEEDEEEEKKRKEDAEIKERKIQELTQQYEAVSKLQANKDEEIAALKAKIAELEKQLKGKEDENVSMATKLTKIEKDSKLEAIKSFVKEMQDEGRLLPKDEAIVVALMEQLDDKAIVKFTQENKEVSSPILEVLKQFISERPKVVEFREIAPQGRHQVSADGTVEISGTTYEVSNLELAAKAQKYAEDNKVSFDQAVVEVQKLESK